MTKLSKDSALGYWDVQKDVQGVCLQWEFFFVLEMTWEYFPCHFPVVLTASFRKVG